MSCKTFFGRIFVSIFGRGKVRVAKRRLSALRLKNDAVSEMIGLGLTAGWSDIVSAMGSYTGSMQLVCDCLSVDGVLISFSVKCFDVHVVYPREMLGVDTEAGWIQDIQTFLTTHGLCYENVTVEFI